MLNRRTFLQQGAGGLLFLTGAAGGLFPRLSRAEAQGPAALPAGTLESSALLALPGKVPLLKRSFRPPNYETPLTYFREDFTDNDAFFVRYHLPFIPRVDPGTWKLTVGGDAAEKTLALSLAELQKGFEQVELAALCQCAGNRRGLFSPHVPGVQWGYGAMGNARWRGVRLRDVLGRAGVKKQAVEVAFEGADGPVAPGTPDFVKSLPLWKALDDSTLIAWQMNGQALPHLNGYPARLVVPGWAGTYWMKHLSGIRVLAQPEQNFWMKSAYRVPRGKFPGEDQFPSQTTEQNRPITEMVVNSLVVSLADGQVVPRGRPVDVQGVAWDGGHGIDRVEVSTDDGKSWRKAELHEDHGRFSLRSWGFRLTPAQAGKVTVMVRARSKSGAMQVPELIANPAGYHHNMIQRLTLTVQ